jgi:hypothetical protein
MMTRVATIFAAMLLPLSAAAAEPTAAPKDKSPDRLVCKTSDQIGSRLKKNKSCRTVKEWADLTAQTQEKTRDIQQVGISCQAPGGPGC